VHTLRCHYIKIDRNIFILIRIDVNIFDEVFDESNIKNSQLLNLKKKLYNIFNFFAI